jgi:cbb3-type cytochrome oxidase subunit 3
MSSELQALAGIVSGVMAGLLLLTFCGLFLWVFASKRRASFESAARLPLEEDVPGDLKK